MKTKTIFLLLLIVSCEPPPQPKTVEKELTHDDSISIYNSIEEKGYNKKASNLLDSIEKKDKYLYQAIKEQAKDRHYEEDGF